MALTTIPIPASNPSGALIGYNNLLTGAADSDGAKALTPNTYERYRPASGAQTMKFQMSALADINYIAIAAHNLVGETVLIQTATTIGGALTDVESISPEDNSPIMITFDSRNVIEVAIVATYSAASEIGIIYAGEYLQMPRSIYGGHTPMALNQDTEYQSVISETGQFLGRSIIRKGLDGSFAWRFLEDDWYRTTFQPFVVVARTLPFFIKWRPDYYDNEVAFGFSKTDISPANMGGGHRLMSVTLNMRGHSDV